MFQNKTPTTFLVQCVYSCKSIANTGAKVMIYYDYDSYSKNTAAYLLSCQRYMELISPPAFTTTISKHQADRM